MVKRIVEFNKLAWTVHLLLLPCSLIVLFLPQTALSESSNSIAILSAEFICYMQNNDGQIINLTKICDMNNKEINGVITSTLSTTDKQFLEDYKGFLKTRLGGSPLIKNALFQAQQSPENIIQRAKGICASIKTGTPEDSQKFAENIDGDIINTMAVEYYCPELDD